MVGLHFCNCSRSVVNPPNRLDGIAAPRQMSNRLVPTLPAHPTSRPPRAKTCIVPQTRLAWKCLQVSRLGMIAFRHTCKEPYTQCLGSFLQHDNNLKRQHVDSLRGSQHQLPPEALVTCANLTTPLALAISPLQGINVPVPSVLLNTLDNSYYVLCAFWSQQARRVTELPMSPRNCMLQDRIAILWTSPQ